MFKRYDKLTNKTEKFTEKELLERLGDNENTKYIIENLKKGLKHENLYGVIEYDENKITT